MTTGATVIFEELIELVLDPLFISTLEELKYTRLILQYGIPSKGEELFLKNLLKDSKVKNNDKWTVKKKGITIEGFSFSADIKSVITGADLVISHAGTGSILDALRVGKKLIVVINANLMDDHQSEVADELAQEGNLLKSTADLQDLISNLRKVQTVELTPLQIPNGNIFQEVLEEV